MVLSAIQTPQPHPECRQQYPEQDQDHVGPRGAGRDLERRQPRHERPRSHSRSKRVG